METALYTDKINIFHGTTSFSEDNVTCGVVAYLDIPRKFTPAGRLRNSKTYSSEETKRGWCIGGSFPMHAGPCMPWVEGV